MDGGFSGKHDELGRLVAQGWTGCGVPPEGTAPAEKTWEKLKGGARDSTA